MGWDSVQSSLAATGDAASLDLHVVGTEFFDRLRQRGFDPQTVAPRLGERYEQDYRDAWIDFLAKTHLERRGLQSGGPWLTELGGNRSPMFQLLAYVDSQTAVDRPTVEEPFAALRALVAPDTVQQLFSEATGRPYLLKLQALAQSVTQLASQPGSPDATQAVRTASSDGVSFVRGIEVDFPTEPAAAQGASEAVASLLTSPFRWADQQAGQGPQLAANQLAREFCSRQESRVLDRFPFHTGAPDAALQDVQSLLNPSGGDLETFFNDAEATGATLNQGYERFRARARDIERAFFQTGGDSPGFQIQFQVHGFEGIDRVELRIDGHARVFTPVQREREPYTWDASRAEQVSLLVQSGDRSEPLEFNGPWAIFRFFHQGSWQASGDNAYLVTWTLPNTGMAVSADVFVRGVPILDRNYLSTFSCPRSIAR
jgi:type VI protein secretion system component VasK